MREDTTTKPTRIITAKHYKAIGEIVTTWGRLEIHIFRTFEALLSLSTNQALAIFWELNFSSRIARLKALVALKWRAENDPRLTNFNKLIDRIEKIYPFRNIAAHSIWRKGKTPNAIVPFYANAKGGKIPRTSNPELFPKPEDREFTAERLHKIALDIYNLAEEYTSFAKIHFGVQFLFKEGNEPLD